MNWIERFYASGSLDTAFSDDGDYTVVRKSYGGKPSYETWSGKCRLMSFYCDGSAEEVPYKAAKQYAERDKAMHE